MGFWVEGVELGGDVRLRADDVELGLRYLVGLVVRVGVGFGLVEGEGGRGRFLGGKRKTGRRPGILGKFHNFFVFYNF